MISVNAGTKLLGILGYPLKHSYSPAMHNTSIEELGLNYLYVPIEVKDEDLRDLVKGIAAMKNFSGFNVTIPHKVNIMKYLDELDELAAAIGAVNTVTVREGRLKGYNTDGIGFLRSIEKEKGITVQGKKVFIIGSGGAAKGVAMTFAFEGAAEIAITNRTYEKAVELAENINRKVKKCSYAVSGKDAEEALSDADIVVNTTSVGMTPHIEETPLEAEFLHRGMLVCDIVYNPLKTRLLQDAEKRGCQTLNGLGMLIYQGAEAFKLWTGYEEPIMTMKNVLSALAG